MQRLGTAVFIVAMLGATGAQGAVGFTDGGGTRLGFGVGRISPQGSPQATWITTNLRIVIADHLSLEPEVGFWNRTPDRNDALADVFHVGTNLVISSRARRIRPWVGAGLGIHLLQNQPESVCYDCGSDEPVSFGFGAFTTAVARAQFLAGLDYAIAGRITFFGAVRLDTTFLPEDDDIATQTKVYAGLRLRF